MTIPEIAPYYQLVVDTNGVLDTLEVRVELADSSLLERYSELDALKKRIHHKLQTVLGISCKISLVEYQSIERTAGKAKRIIDLRNNGRII